MARFNDTNVPNAIRPYLQAGETLKHWAYGVKQPNLVLIAGLIALAILPGLLAVHFLTKNYIVAITDRRLIILSFARKLKIKEVKTYPIDQLPTAAASVGPIFTHLRLKDSKSSFYSKFHRMGMPNNRMHSLAIVNIVVRQKQTDR